MANEFATLSCPCCGKAADFHVDQGVLACPCCSFQYKFSGQVLRHPSHDAMKDRPGLAWECGCGKKA